MGVLSMSVLSHRAPLVASVLLALSGSAQAMSSDNFFIDDVYADAEKLTVGVNLARKSCVMDMEFVGNTEIQIGKDANGSSDQYYMMFANPGWTYEEGGDYAVTVKFNQVSTWNGDGVGMRLHKYRGVSLEGIKKGVIDEFASMRTLSLRIGKTNYGTFNLTTTGKGVAKLEECARAVANGNISLASIAERIAANSSAAGPAAPNDDNRYSKPPAREDSAPEANRPEANRDEDEGRVGYSTGTGFFIASRRKGSPSSWLRMTSTKVVTPRFWSAIISRIGFR